MEFQWFVFVATRGTPSTIMLRVHHLHLARVSQFFYYFGLSDLWYYFRLNTTSFCYSICLCYFLNIWCSKRSERRFFPLFPDSLKPDRF